jgi:hypothetical protein
MRPHLPLVLLASAACALAHAQDRRYAYVVELAAPTQRTDVRAGGVDWTCSGTRCTAEARGGAVSVRGCSELARAVGPVRRYASEIRSLDEKALAECNRIATAAAPAAAAAASAAPKAATPKPAGGRAVTPEMTYTGVWPGGREAKQ